MKYVVDTNIQDKSKVDEDTVIVEKVNEVVVEGEKVEIFSLKQTKDNLNKMNLGGDNNEE